MAESTTDLKVELTGLKKDIENTQNLNSRLDTAIEKLTDVYTSIKQMLAVHEEKLSHPITRLSPCSLVSRFLRPVTPPCPLHGRPRPLPPSLPRSLSAAI